MSGVCRAVLRALLWLLLLSLLGLAGCDGGGSFIVEVVEFAPGPGAGFGAEALPDVVLGPPQGGSTSQGSVDVISLGVGGSITVALGTPAKDGAGADLIVFENAFLVGGDRSFAEPGIVEVSADGVSFVAFPCDIDGGGAGCAGQEPVLANAENGLATDPDAAGGDAFDLGEVQLSEARYVRITDSGRGAPIAPTAGFDLDAIAVAAR